VGLLLALDCGDVDLSYFILFLVINLVLIFKYLETDFKSVENMLSVSSMTVKVKQKQVTL